MKIAVLEKLELTGNQISRLEALGQVSWYDSSNDEEALKRASDSDVVIVDWIDPSGFLLKMKKNSLVSLMSTGYAWVKNREEAARKGVLVSNVPGYATEAVAEHLFGLILCAARKTILGDRSIRSGNSETGHLRGMELYGKTIGIIGLGNIGTRLSEISKAFGMNVIAHTRSKKELPGVKMVDLDELVSNSDVIAACCSLNEDTKNLINRENMERMKESTLLVSATWDVIKISDVIPILQEGRIGALGLDVAVEGGGIDLPEDLLNLENVVLTPHVAFNTNESKQRQADICIDNVENFLRGAPTNIV